MSLDPSTCGRPACGTHHWCGLATWHLMILMICTPGLRPSSLKGLFWVPTSDAPATRDVRNAGRSLAVAAMVEIFSHLRFNSALC